MRKKFDQEDNEAGVNLLVVLTDEDQDDHEDKEAGDNLLVVFTDEDQDDHEDKEPGINLLVVFTDEDQDDQKDETDGDCREENQVGGHQPDNRTQKVDINLETEHRTLT